MSVSLRKLRARFEANLRNPKLRRNVAIRMAGKLLGLGIVMLVMTTVIPRIVHAGGAADGPTPEINAMTPPVHCSAPMVGRNSMMTPAKLISTAATMRQSNRFAPCHQPVKNRIAAIQIGAV